MEHSENIQRIEISLPVVLNNPVAKNLVRLYSKELFDLDFVIYPELLKMRIKPEELDCGTVDDEQLPAYSTPKFLIRINDEILDRKFSRRINSIFSEIFNTPHLSKFAKYVRKLVQHDGKMILNLNLSTEQRLLAAARYTYFLEKHFFNVLDFFFRKVKDDISFCRPRGAASQKPVKISVIQMFFCFEQLEGSVRARIFRQNELDQYWREYFHLKAALQLQKTEEKYDILFENFKVLAAEETQLALEEWKNPAKSSPKGSKKSSTPMAYFPQLDGLKWEEVTIAFISEESIKISARKISKTYTYAEIGFKDNRKREGSDTRWPFLKGMAQNQGELSWHTPLEIKDRDRAKAAIRDLRKRLRAIVNINDNPFFSYRKYNMYRTKFTLRDETFDPSRPNY
jgi:hypothetical protein